MGALEAERWRDAVSSLRTWKRGEQRAVHKPLLLLLLIADAQRGGNGRREFVEIETHLAQLLRDFGPPRKSVHPEHPFWYLQNDGLWEVEDADSFPLKKAGSSVAIGVLRERNAAGYVSEPLWNALASDARVRLNLVDQLLGDYWPESLHAPVRLAAGLADEVGGARERARAPRDPNFREAVLRAYEHRCAVCGYDGRLGREDLALEAAHVRWHCYAGPDELANGLALCSFHHKALDRGALGLTEDGRIRVSSEVHGTEMVELLLLRYTGRPLRAPQPGMDRPFTEHIGWHGREVFREPARMIG